MTQDRFRQSQRVRPVTQLLIQSVQVVISWLARVYKSYSSSRLPRPVHYAAPLLPHCRCWYYCTAYKAAETEKPAVSATSQREPLPIDIGLRPLSYLRPSTSVRIQLLIVINSRSGLLATGVVAGSCMRDWLSTNGRQ